jgi:hypothetical protein
MVLIYAFSAPGSIPRPPTHRDKVAHAAVHARDPKLYSDRIRGGVRGRRPR